MLRVSSKGFTLIETLIAISVLLIVIVGPMTIAQKGIQSSFFSSDQLTATFLAQEAMEAIREVRDNEALDALRDAEDDNFDSNATWDWFAAFNSVCDEGCSFDVEAITDHTEMFESCGAGDDTCGQIYIDSGSGGDDSVRYVTSNTGILSPFTRVITIKEAADPPGPTLAPEAAEITVEVSWKSAVFGEEPRTLTMRSWIYNHYKRYGIAP